MLSPGADSSDDGEYQENGPADAEDSADESTMQGASFVPGEASASGSLMSYGDSSQGYYSAWQDDGIDSAASGVSNTDNIAGMRELDRLEKRRSEWSRRLDEEERKLDDLIQMNRTIDMFNNDNYQKDLHEIWRNIVEVTHEIRQHKPVSFSRQKMRAERRYTKKLRNDYARIRYKAKYKKF